MAWHFDELDDRVTIADDGKLSLGSNTTVGGWFRITDNVGAIFQYLYSHDDYNTNPSLNFFIAEDTYVVPADRNLLIVNFSQAVLRSVTTVGTSLLWQHCCFVQDSPALETRLYINGVWEAAGAYRGATNPVGSLYFGARNDLDANRFFGGDLAEWFKVDRVLSAAEILALAQGASPNRIADSSLNCWYCPMESGMYRELRADWLTVAEAGGVASADHAPVAAPFGVDYFGELGPHAVMTKPYYYRRMMQG